MTPFQRLLREPAVILAVVTAGIALAIAFGVHITDVQTAALLGFLAAAVGLLRFLLTPSSEVVAQQKKGEPVKAGAKAENFGIESGKVVHVNPA